MVALYERVKRHIVRHIHDGSWPPGHRLPSEHELVAQFGISRMTANRALRELADEGRVVRTAGIGSFVAQAKPQSTLLQIANIASDIRARGHVYGYQLLSAERAAAGQETAVLLGIRAGETVFHSVCLHLEDGVPVQLEDRFVNPGAVPGFLEQDLRAMAPSEYLVRHVPYDQIEHLVDAVLPTKAQARQLAIAEGEPCLLLTRRTWNGGRTVTWVRCLHPASRYRLGSRFRADGRPSEARIRPEPLRSKPADRREQPTQ